MKVLAVVLAALFFVLVSCSPNDDCKVEKLLSNDDTEINIE